MLQQASRSQGQGLLIFFILVEVENQDESVSLADEDQGGRDNLNLDSVTVLNRDSFDPQSHHGVVFFHIKKCKYHGCAVSGRHYCKIPSVHRNFLFPHSESC